MHRSLATLAAALIVGTSLHAADEAAVIKDAPAQVIRWTGSAYKDGDAFIVTASIYPTRVEMRWDGFMKPLRFLDEPEEPRPPRVQKDYRFTDAATVEAFKVLAAQAKQCDPGYSSVLGQGISTEVAVESPLGKEVQEMRYFVTPPRLVKALRFEDIPFAAGVMARAETAAEVPASAPFSKQLRDLAADLVRFDTCQRKLVEAYMAKAELPVKELDGVRAALHLVRAYEVRREKDEHPELSKRALVAAGAVLRDCLGPVNRARFTGGESGEGGVIVVAEQVLAESDLFFFSVPPESLAVNLGTAGDPVCHLSKEMEDVLLQFLAGAALEANEKARDLSLVVPLTYELGLSNSGKLTIGLSDMGKRLNTPGGLPELDLNPSLKDAELLARLEYLNSKGIVRFLLGREADGHKVPALVRINELRLNLPELDRAKIEFSNGESEHLTQVYLVEGRWVPGKVLTGGEYRQWSQTLAPGEAGGDPFAEDDQSKSK